MNLPTINIDDIDIKLRLDDLVLNVLYVKFGYFHQTMPKHSHSHGSYELHYIPRGRGLLIANGLQYTLTPGTLFMTGPEVEHEQIPDQTDPMAEYCIFFEIISGPFHLKQNSKDLSRKGLLSRWLLDTPFWIGPDQENMMTLFEMLAWEVSLKPIGFHHMATNILEMIVARTIRHYHQGPIAVLNAPVKTLNDSRLVAIENSFLYDYQSITLKQLADKIGLSTRQTERTVQKQYGMSFKDKKWQARMEAAAQLLLTTDLLIREVAIAAGFSTPERFSHSFKKYYDQSPSKYRSEHRVDGING
ncbi:AraC family transcriptional regulator [Paenibacillus polysaccharolyticus]|uniref:helix-turn-helix transcriptional regulator n=1 Tax=Paenibacillus polysaccharolyticus TaxID=582692 RepID=UPI00203BD87D|nr:AraC family transcriptional regulator [Paenibacillus polysaccharolyticus]MCM3132968.1 AraC family transcriptional regulator [Paenibacillus polysaccharolyticus]